MNNNNTNNANTIINNTIILLDNFDSFTYNLANELKNKGLSLKIFRNNLSAKVIFNEIENIKKITGLTPILVISPGPGNPTESGCLMELIALCHRKIPMLGICLGHQALCQFYGANIVKANVPMHGKSSLILHNADDIFNNIPNPARFARYHSLVAENIPNNLTIIAQFEDIVMGVINRQDRILGFQFHPESIMSPFGSILLHNSLKFLASESSEQITQSLLNKLYNNEQLLVSEIQSFFAEVIKGNVDNSVLSSALTAMKIRGETPIEISGAAKAFLQFATPFNRPNNYIFGDIVGTGGDGLGTINVSTTAAMVATYCGVKVAKHGNRSVSSKSGASDLLTAMGINVNISPESARACLDEIGMCFLFAPLYHKGFKNAVNVRQSLKTRTLFNLLGPLVNPAKPDFALVGVYSKDLLLQMAASLKELGYKRALVVYGGGSDEIAIHTNTNIAELKANGDIISYELNVADFNFNQQYNITDILGGNPQENKVITENILQGKASNAHTDLIAVNAGALLYLSGKVNNLVEGYKTAKQQILSGLIYEKIAKKLINFTQSCKL